MSIQNNITEEIKSKILLSEVIQNYVNWDSKKSNISKGIYWACCPFHNEKTASFTVDNSKNTYHCFGCNAHGDAFKFLMDHQNIQFREALTILAGMSGVKLNPSNNYNPIEDQKRQILQTINEEASNFFRGELLKQENKQALNYLETRGLGAEDINKFALGYARGDGKLIPHLNSIGYNNNQIQEAGLIIENDQGNFYERFRNRIMFPITNPQNKIIAFGGRDLSGNSQAKYINSPETKIFQKKNILYNFYNAKNVRNTDRKILAVEGYFDCISLSVNGFQNSVATMGTSLSQDQIKLLWQLSSIPLLCYDGDEAGIKAAERVVELIFPILKPGYSMNFVFLPKGMDPDDVIKDYGTEYINELSNNSISLIDLFWNLHINDPDYGTPEERAHIQSHMNAMINRIENIEVRKQYSLHINDKLNAFWKSKSFESNKVFFKNKIKKPSSDLIRKLNVGNNNLVYKKEEIYLIQALLNYPEILSDHSDDLITIKLSDDKLDKLRSEIIDTIYSKKITNQNVSHLGSILVEKGFEEILNSINTEYKEFEIKHLANKEQQMELKYWFRNLIYELRKHDLNRKIETTKQEYIRNNSKENEEKLFKLKDELSSLNELHKSDVHDIGTISNSFDDWYEKNKSRLKKNN
ncbi:MAG: DNA primase [Hyphomicrobiales bacterium]